MDKNVIVTGGAGYIGSHACKALAGRGFTPVAVDNLCYGHRWAVRWGDLHELDIRDLDRTSALFQAVRPVAVMHFAAFAYVGESVTDPRKYYENNLGGTLSLLGAMQSSGCDKIIFSSTCATYGLPERMPINESAPQHPINPYGRSKHMVEQVLGDYGRAYGLRSFCLRYFNAAGADPDGEIGEAHDPETHLIPLAVLAALGKAPALSVFGDDYPTPDGTAMRDYVHVNDLAEAHVAALNHLMDGGDSKALNLGTGHGYSVRQVLDAVEKSSGLKVPCKQAPRREGDPPELVADASLARSVLGWECACSDLETIIDSALRWHRSERSQRP